MPDLRLVRNDATMELADHAREHAAQLRLDILNGKINACEHCTELRKRAREAATFTDGPALAQEVFGNAAKG